MASSARARGLGAELKALREAAGFEAKELGKRLGWSKSTMSRAESGSRRLNEADVSAILAIIGVTGPERDRLLGMAREIDQPGWWETSNTGLPAQLAALLSFERDANHITESSVALVPGLLQTSDYARALMLGAGVAPGEVEARVAVRRGRQDILTQRSPVEMITFIDESALLRRIGTPVVMAGQLRHLVEMTKLSNIELRILPFGTHPGIDGPFLLLEFPRARSIVHLEHHRSSAFVDEPKDVAAYTRLRDSLTQAAFTPEESTELLSAHAEKWKGEDT